MKGTPMLALTDHFAGGDGSAFSVIMNDLFWPTVPYVAGGAIILVALLSELDVIALMGGRQAYLKRPSGLLRLALASVAMVVFWQMTTHSEPIRDSRLFEVLPITSGALGFLVAALAFVVIRGDRLTRAGVGCPGASVGGAALMACGGPARTTATPERDDTDGATK
ncbi:hypothetical protein D6M20_02500 (plasmid) [Rhodococcus qingshengii]|uniref:Uncharacterized protein n=2 Tax=Rhodococcus TaxID=1827 RepID=A0A8I0ZWR6_RHOER|nr:hypothetical protein [Rhodococcus erythropolis]QEM25729.1 hypothetical protein D6M20_02500 [Rhodococcus qingshengii]